jgi:AcrR family transcriptional regulator
MAGRPAEPGVIWTRPERAARGPRPAHSRAEITAAAVRLADAAGIEGLSMRSVAAELGMGTMSLYNYVPRKEDMYELMVDAVGAEYDFAEPTGDWRSDLMDIARRMRGVMHQHPWVLRLMTSGYGFSPNALRYLEHALACLDPLDLPSASKMELIGLINALVAAYVGNELAAVERARTLPWSEEQEQAVRSAYLGRELASGRYPRLAAGLAGAAASAGAQPDIDAAFGSALSRILDSYAAQVS